VGWYRFGEFEIDLDRFVLTRNGVVQPLQPKVFNLLAYLVTHHGVLVTKAELLREIWHDEYVNESVIAWSVSHIRRALGQQSGRHPIETVPTRGYRFSAEVTKGESPARKSQTGAAPATAVAAAAASTMVGRAQVMSELRQLVDDAGRGHGALCVLTGASGIGKTRVADELSSYARAAGLQVLWGRCPQHAAVPTLWPIAAAFRGLSREQADLAARMQDAVAGGDEAAASPEDRRAGARFWLIERVAALLNEAVAARPTLLILDDLHWADAGTLDLLGFLAPDLRDAPLVVVATLRDGELSPGSALDQPMRRMLRYARTIPLVALDASEVADLTQTLCDQRPSEALAEAIRRAGGGVPLFVQEIVRSLAREHGAQALARLSPDAVRLPALARDLLRQRIQRLPPATIELLSSAAVIGDVFDLSLLLGLVELDPETMLERLEPALAEGQLEIDAPHTYRFVHTLFQSVLYDDLPAAQRVAMHRKIGTLLLSRFADERDDGEVARHFYLSLPAGDQRQVQALARTAGEAAQRAYAHEKAIVYYGWALEAQAFGGAEDPRERAQLLLALASAQRLSGRTQESFETTSRLLEIAQAQNMSDIVVRATRLRRPTVAMSMVPDALARSTLEAVLEHTPAAADPTRISALSQLACIPPYGNDLSRSKSLSAQALELARELPDPEPTLEAMRARLFALSGPDDVAELLQVAGQMLSAESAGTTTAHTLDARTACYSAYLLSGQIGAADGVLRESTALVTDQHWPEAAFFWERLATQRRFLDGHFEEADRRWKVLYARALRAGLSYADMFYNMHVFNLALEREGAKQVFARTPISGPAPRLTPYLRAGLARLAAEAGAHDHARGQLSALGDLTGFPRDGHYLHALANVATCASVIGDKPRCEQLFTLLAPYAELNTPSQMGYYIGSVSHFLGLLAAALERDGQASEYFARALELNGAMGYRTGVVRTALAHGRLQARLGHTRPAQELLSRARDEARALGMNAALAEADAALRG
jgi:DNA-binding winged helix-turn-helix (wHTH) protein/tetratricopeptide (TPR) repeat protein